MYDPMEIIGRYVLTGIILIGALFIMMVVRLIYIAFKPENDCVAFLNAMLSYGEENGNNKTKWGRLIMEFVFWPYGVVAITYRYMKAEGIAIEKMREQIEKSD